MKSEKAANRSCNSSGEDGWALNRPRAPVIRSMQTKTAVEFLALFTGHCPFRGLKVSVCAVSC